MTIENIRLLATDLDGTLIGRVSELPLYPRFGEQVEVLRRQNGAVWAACTGRSLRSFKAFFRPMRHMGIRPDYVIVHHAFIYRFIAPFGYVPRVFWNLHIYRVLLHDRIHVKEAITQWYELITESMHGVKTVHRERNRLCFRFPSQEACDAAAELLKPQVARFSHLQIFQFIMELDIRPVPYTKGLSLSELSRQLGIKPHEILAIGNGHNDISMLKGEVAASSGCPSNSEAKVMKAVHEAGGHIANKRSLGGVLEILEAYRNGTVSSALPDWWEDPSESANPRARGSGKRHHHNRPFSRRQGILLASVIYVILLVFAQYDVLPYSGLIRKPFELFVQALTWIASPLF